MASAMASLGLASMSRSSSLPSSFPAASCSRRRHEAGLTELQRNEKSAVTQMFERESKREKNLEARAKELRAKERREAENKKSADAGEKKAPWEDTQKELEDKFWAIVNEHNDGPEQVDGKGL